MQNNIRAIYSFSIDVSSHVTKKNRRPIYKNRSTGSLFLGKNLKLQAAENNMLMQLLKQCNELNITKPINYPIWCVFKFHFPKAVYYTKKGLVSKTLPDLSNLYQLPEDLLQKAGIIVNDNLIYAHDHSRRLCRDEYKLEIHIYKFEDN